MDGVAQFWAIFNYSVPDKTSVLCQKVCMEFCCYLHCLIFSTSLISTVYRSNVGTPLFHQADINLSLFPYVGGNVSRSWVTAVS